MSVQLSTTVRNAKLDAIQTAIGTVPHLKFWTGSLPANTAAADAGTALADFTLPSVWMAAASGGVKAKAGTWQVNAAASGTAVHYRIYDSSAVCHLQGTVTLTGVGGDLTLDNTNIASGQQITVTSYSWTEGNA